MYVCMYVLYICKWLNKQTGRNPVSYQAWCPLISLNLTDQWHSSKSQAEYPAHTTTCQLTSSKHDFWCH